MEVVFCFHLFVVQLHSELLLFSKPVLSELVNSLANDLVTGIEPGSEREKERWDN